MAKSLSLMGGIALSYLKKGISIFPLWAKSKTPLLSKKTWECTWQEYQNRLPSEEDVIEWWTRWPDANIAIITGEISGILVLDVDGKEAEDYIEQNGFEIPLTVTSKTKKGFHYLFKHPKDGRKYRNFANTGIKMDFRGDGGYIVAPPSVHPDGPSYQWERDLDSHPLAETPQWLINMLTVKEEPRETEFDWILKEKIGNFNPQLLQRGDVQKVCEGCNFIKHCQDYASTLSEPEWHAMICNLSLAENGPELVHELSRPHKKYSFEETQRKIERAIEESKPHTCQHIQDNLGFTGCPPDGCGVRAPIGLSIKTQKPEDIVESKLEDIKKDHLVAFEPDIVDNLALVRQKDYAKYEILKENIKRANKKVKMTSLEKSVKEKLDKPKLHVVEDEDEQTLDDTFSDIPVEGLKCPDRYQIRRDGVYLLTADGFLRICAVPLILTRRLIHIKSEKERIEVAFLRDNKWKTIIMDRSVLFSRNGILTLADASLPITSESAKYLVKYLGDFEASNLEQLEIAKSIDHMGWVDNETFLPYEEQDVVMDMSDGINATVNSYRCIGTLEDWVNFVTPIREHPIAWFTISSAFAAPLLRIVRGRIFFIHNYGPSRGGKTAVLRTTLSVWGNPDGLLATFNATAAGFEKMAAFYNDLPLGIDEKQIAKDRQGQVEAMIYQLSSGKGKLRSNKNGGIQETSTWRSIFITTGEEPLSTYNSDTGIYTRSLEVYGPPITNEDLAREIHQKVDNVYGVAGKAYIAKLIEFLAQEDGEDKVRQIFDQIFNHLKHEYPESISSHVSAVSTVALGNYFANLWIFGISKEKSFSHSVELAEFILQKLESSSELDQTNRCTEYLMGWLAQNKERFREGSFQEPYGFEDEGIYYIFPHIFEKTLAEEGFSPKRILKDYAEKHWVLVDNRGGKRRYKVRKTYLDQMQTFYAINMNEINASGESW